MIDCRVSSFARWPCRQQSWTKIMLQSSLSDASTATSKRSLASLADQIWDSLRTAIIRGDLAPGERLIELKIAEQMGTSQGPAHKTLQCLEYEGFVKLDFVHLGTLNWKVSQRGLLLLGHCIWNRRSPVSPRHFVYSP